MKSKWWALVAVCTGTFMLLLDVTIVIVALPPVQRSLHASFNDVEWVVDAYALTLASLLLTTGALADRYGRRRLFTIGLVIFTLGSLTCGLAQSPLMLIVSRSAQGVGGAIMFSTSLALLAQAFRGRDRGIAFGVWGAITGVAVSLGPVLGGVITTGISWRGIFLVNVPIGVVAVAVTLWQVEESKEDHPGRPDWTGFALLTAGLVSLVYGLTRASETSWGNATVVTTLALGGILLVGFVLAEAVGRHPLFDLGLFRTPTFVGGLVAAFTMNGSLFAMFVFVVLYLQDVLGYTALHTGLCLLTSTGGMFLAATVSGRLSERAPVRWLIAPGLALVGLGLLLMTGLRGTSTWTHLLPGLVVSGVGSGLVNPPLASTAVGVVPYQRAGMASGVNSTLRQVGFATSIAALGTIFSTALRDHLTTKLSSVPVLSRHAAQTAALLRQGNVGRAIDAAPPHARALLASAIRSSFASAVDDLVTVTGVLALAGAVGALALIRRKDFIPRGAPV
ncbi:MAG TPA: MFS transporter, partial [Acidimicrobiales bacterium]|nr:MFS transporter [Acidimicrobiales bacterium]